MPTLALALSMLALEQAVTAAREQAAKDPEPEPIDAAARVAQAAAWRRWAADGLADADALPADTADLVRPALPNATPG